MSPETFRNRLEDGRCNNYLYKMIGREGLVSVWKHQGSYVLTWEECPNGQQSDEASYTRDERHLLASLDEVIRFLTENRLTPAVFRP